MSASVAVICRPTGFRIFECLVSFVNRKDPPFPRRRGPRLLFPPLSQGSNPRTAAHVSPYLERHGPQTTARARVIGTVPIGTSNPDVASRRGRHAPECAAGSLPIAPSSKNRRRRGGRVLLSSCAGAQLEAVSDSSRPPTRPLRNMALARSLRNPRFDGQVVACRPRLGIAPHTHLPRASSRS